MGAETGEGDRGGSGARQDDQQQMVKAAVVVGAAKTVTTAEALKEAARAGVAERWARIEDCSKFGCVDWYLYPGERSTNPDA
jgi:hypothetical protein